MIQWLPGELRRWKPKKKSSPLPAPPLAYHEREAACDRGYTETEWDHESPQRKAKVVAHYLHRMLRESFDSEQMSNKKDSKEMSGQSYESLMAAMGLQA